MFAIRKDGFKAHPAVVSDLDLVEEDDQFTHLLQLDDVTTGLEQLSKWFTSRAKTEMERHQLIYNRPSALCKRS